jgi:hypothetical protein
VSEDRKRSGPIWQIIVGVTIAILVGSSSPWWWSEFFGGDKSEKNSEQTPIVYITNVHIENTYSPSTSSSSNVVLALWENAVLIEWNTNISADDYEATITEIPSPPRAFFQDPRIVKTGIHVVSGKYEYKNIVIPGAGITEGDKIKIDIYLPGKEVVSSNIYTIKSTDVVNK